MVDFRISESWEPPGQKEIKLYREGKQVGIISSGEDKSTIEISFFKKVTTKIEAKKIIQIIKRGKEYLIKIFIPEG